ncbi:short-chain fatty acid transporter [Pseudoalteromonas fenneropenaei]|uniref:Short-chain fatty acid transporter n=1 Tax=Pseudoalteromonas fenneropenaei TaxID=1737459 RepID=A0ABV7CKA4_9GAMM
MLNRIAQPLSKVVERYLPDPFVFVILLTLIVLGCAVLWTPMTPISALQAWGDGFWNLLAFAMQMVLILISGHMLANTPFCSKLLDKLASKATSAAAAIVMVTLVAMLASWINWGFGLVVGVLFAKALARRVAVDYRLLVASSYSGFIVWHGGLSGSVPLTIATLGHFAEQWTGVIEASSTLFAPFNLAIIVTLFIVMPILNLALLPKPQQRVIVDPRQLTAPPLATATPTTPAEQLEHSRMLGTLIGLVGLSYLGYYFIFLAGALNLNIVIALFLFLAITLHQTPARLLASLQTAIQGASGIVIQFPFYAGIMAVMVKSGLAADIANAFIAISSAESLPFWSFISAGLINIMVPSGGGQWAVQAPIVLPAAEALGADLPRVAMAVAWGDAWTNLIQPFWALPVLAIAGLRAKDIMGFCVLQLCVSGIVIAACLTWVA